MAENKRKAVLILAGVVILGLAVVYLPFLQPSHNGRPLESWVADFRLMGGPRHERAREAVRRMGTNAIPKLIEMLRAEDPDWKLKLQDWTETWPLKYRFQPASVKHWRAMVAFEALGPEAVPVLLQLQTGPVRTMPIGTNFVLSDRNVVRTIQSEPESALAEAAILHIGESAVPPLEAALSNKNSEIRLVAAHDLGGIKSEAVAAVPALKKVLEDKDQRVRNAATNALRSIESLDADPR